jgi:outer membrane receptor protein involved in Fe transport
VFAEAVVPLARDMTFAKALDLNTAVRYTDYSTSGTVTTYKVGASWRPIDDLRFRVTQSRDIRAPNIPELFSQGTQSSGSVIVNGVTTPAILQISGNPSLKPERANTVTAGFVWTPTFLQRLTFSADYYKIQINDVISTLTAQQVVDQCTAGNATACASVIRNSAGAVTRVIATSQNLNKLNTEGVDYELSYLPSHLVFGGNLTLRAIAGNLLKQERQVPGGAPIDLTGEVGLSANPRWLFTPSADWQREAFGLFVQARYIGAGKFDNSRVEGVTITDNRIPAVAYVDATASYRFHEHVQAYLTINNLFNKEPPRAPNGTLCYFYPTNPQLYDVVGRYFSLRVNLRF